MALFSKTTKVAWEKTKSETVYKLCKLKNTRQNENHWKNDLPNNFQTLNSFSKLNDFRISVSSQSIKIDVNLTTSIKNSFLFKIIVTTHVITHKITQWKLIFLSINSTFFLQFKGLNLVLEIKSDAMGHFLLFYILILNIFSIKVSLEPSQFL